MGLITVQVKAHRVGALYSVLPIRDDGSVLARERSLAVSFPQSTLGVVEIGTVWVVSGITTQTQYRTSKGYLVTEDLLVAKKAIYRRLSRDVLAFWIQSNVDGIGPVISSRIARTEGVDQLIQSNDVDALCKIEGVNEARATRLIENWPGAALMDAIEWLQASGLPQALGKRLIRLFGEQAIDVLEANPFLLLSFGVPFEEVSKMAFSNGVEPTAPEALGAIAAHVAWRVSSRNGSIGVDRGQLMDGLRRLIGGNLPDDAPEIALRQGGLVAVGNFGFATYGAASIEKEVAQSMAEAIRRKPGDGALLASWEMGLTEDRVQLVIDDLESELPFSLYDEQRSVVVQSVLSSVACITGGAGTGKTTILRWILHVYEKLAPGLAVYQVALSGRAARRMSESTGREASTIARFVGDHLGEGKPRLPEHLLLVIDEASMVDLLSMFKLFAVLPKAARILFVGDSQQLPPVGPGLVFHSLIKPDIPVSVSTLSQVRRQDEASGILKFATSIRHGRIDWSATVPYSEGMDGDCHFDEILDQETLFRYWQGGGGAEASIVLTPVRDGEFGVDELNASFQAKVGHDRPALIWPECGSARIQWRNSNGHKLFLGDPVMVTRNDYKLDVRNGDLGVIVEVFPEAEPDGSVGTVRMDSELMPITLALLDKLDLAYAVTVHKSQGSQWDQVIFVVPPDHGSFVDRSLVYTGVTRPTKRLIVMAPRNGLTKAVGSKGQVERRKTVLGSLIRQELSLPGVGAIN